MEAAGGGGAGDRPLALLAAPGVHGDGDPVVVGGAELVDERPPRARGQLPIEHARVVARRVLAHAVELLARAFPQRWAPRGASEARDVASLADLTRNWKGEDRRRRQPPTKPKESKRERRLDHQVGEFVQSTMRRRPAKLGRRRLPRFQPYHHRLRVLPDRLYAVSGQPSLIRQPHLQRARLPPKRLLRRLHLHAHAAQQPSSTGGSEQRPHQGAVDQVEQVVAGGGGDEQGQHRHGQAADAQAGELHTFIKGLTAPARRAARRPRLPRPRRCAPRRRGCCRAACDERRRARPPS